MRFKNNKKATTVVLFIGQRSFYNAIVKRKGAPRKEVVVMAEDIDELFDMSGLGDVDYAEMLLALLNANGDGFYADPEYPEYNDEGGFDE